MSRYMHLSGFMIHCPAPHTQLSWVHAHDSVPHQWHEPGYWQTIGQTLERGKFDMFFFADQWAAYDIYKDTMDPVLEYAVQFPIHDPTVLVPAISAVTEPSRCPASGRSAASSTPPFPATALAPRRARAHRPLRSVHGRCGRAPSASSSVR